MPKRRRDKQFDESLYTNNATYTQYFNRLMELSISMFEWKNLPSTIDARFLEYILFSDGYIVFFEDEVMGYLCLQCMIGGKLNVYRIPCDRTAYATNGYNKKLDGKNSVIIYNNLIHTNSILDVKMFAKRLYDLDCAIDVNSKAQKTPIMIQCKENERLSMVNLYKEYDGNAPFIFADDRLSADNLKVLQTGAPFVADRLYQLKTQYWNEALTYLGISNVNVLKKERLLSDEVTSNNGGVIASRYSRLEARQYGVKQINDMFGLNIEVDYRKDYNIDIDLFNDNGVINE